MSEPKANELMEKIVSVCKRRGFVFPSSEIYGGINGFWDYGPLGAELKRNVKDLWWRSMTQSREDVAGLEATIIMHPRIWEASGHTSTFSDPMVDCLLTKKRFRADQIEPQTGVAYHYAGALAEDGTSLAQPFSVLLTEGKHPDSARKIARQYYEQRGLKVKELQGEQTEKLENSIRYNPENGGLLTEPRAFNLMFKTYVGPVESEDNIA
jgi:glycyl-tRNA synthetase